jgi:hypothetical protein
VPGCPAEGHVINGDSIRRPKVENDALRGADGGVADEREEPRDDWDGRPPACSM